jgi:hypothetical protein
MLRCLIFISLQIHVKDQYISAGYLFSSIQTELLTIEVVFSCAPKAMTILIVFQSLRCLRSIQYNDQCYTHHKRTPTNKNSESSSDVKYAAVSFERVDNEYSVLISMKTTSDLSLTNKYHVQA